MLKFTLKAIKVRKKPPENFKGGKHRVAIKYTRKVKHKTIKEL